MKLNEMEIKIALTSEEHIKRTFETCKQLFGPPVSHLRQLDEYYDTSDEQLKKQDLVIRIRTANGKQTIALKSPRVKLPSGITNRIELEFVAAEGEKVHEQLLRQGLTHIETAEKERWTFIHHDCEIVLDKLPFIGTFVEIEGPSEAAIHQVVELIGLSSCEVVKKHYGELMTAKFKELQLPVSQICATFAKERELLNKREL